MKKLSKILLSAAIVSAAAAMTAVTASAVAPAEGVSTPSKFQDQPAPLVTLQELPNKVTRKGPTNPYIQAAPAQGGEYRCIPLVIITIGFDDMPYSDEYDWGSTIFQGDRSLRQYYLDQSFGQFTFEPVEETCAYGVDGNTNTADDVNDGIIHIKLDRNHEDWTLSSDPDNHDHLMEAFHEAVTASMAYIDYSVYDTDGDGLVANDELAVGFVVAGYEAAASENYAMGIEKYLWAHAAPYADYYYSYFEEYPMYGDVTLNHYITIAETVVNDEHTDDPQQASIAVLAHELGHYLGLPDLYDIDYTSSGEWEGYSVGRLSVMCSGNWGTDPDTGATTPYSFDAWSKSQLGWVEPQLITKSDVYDINGVNPDAIGNGVDVLLFPVSDTEYYLIENRRFVGWDAGLANEVIGFDGSNYYANTFNPDGGLIFWHIDNEVLDTYGNGVNVITHRPGVMPFFLETSDSSITPIDETVSDLGMFSKTLTDLLTGDESQTIDFPLWTYGGSDSRADRYYTGDLFTVLTPGQQTMQMRFTCARNNCDVATVLGTSLSMQGDIGMNLFLQLPLEVAEDDGAYVKFEGPNGTVTIPVADGEDPEDNVYRFTYEVFPRQIFDTITVGLYGSDDTLIALYDQSGNAVSDAQTVFTTTVNDYIQSILSNQNYGEELRTLAEKLYNYGIYAALYIKDVSADYVLPENLPAAPALDAMNVDDLADYAVSEGTEVPGDVEIVGYSLLMRSTTNLRVYFRTADASAYSYAINGNDATVACLREPEGTKKGSYYVEVQGYPSYALLKPVTVTINDMEISVSPMSYVKLVFDHYADVEEKAPLCNVMQAMYEYAKAADAYFQ